MLPPHANERPEFFLDAVAEKAQKVHRFCVAEAGVQLLMYKGGGKQHGIGAVSDRPLDNRCAPTCEARHRLPALARRDKLRPGILRKGEPSSHSLFPAA
jgi:hypothetical protein